MKKKPQVSGRIVVPKFGTEAEEAEWWYKNRHIHDKIFHEAVKSGRAQILTKERLRDRIAAARKKTASPVIGLRIPAEDLTLARRQAKRKGLPYQTYMKSILHETLIDREKAERKRNAG